MSLLLARMRRRAAEERGFSLVELLVVILIGGVVMSVTTNAIITAFTSQRRQTAQLQSLTDAKVTFERLTRDVRAANPLLRAREGVIQVEIVRGARRHAITYTLAGTELRRREVVRNASTGAVISDNGDPADPNAPGPVVLRGLDMPAGTPVFSYFALDDDGSRLPLTAPEPPAPLLDTRQVGYVGIDLRVLPAEATRPIELTSEVRLRNDLS